MLVQVKERPGLGRYLTLPGGRQEFGETMQACLVRECEEEIGIAPAIGGLLHVADVLQTRPDGPRHLTEMLFACTLPPEYTPQMGPRPDKRQVATIWADPVTDGPLFLPRYDRVLMQSDAPAYLGCFSHEIA
ncbi:hypothetical protein RGUI_1593 [Rhodovulum sp. P5]|nr:hypothetical protein RGUI_1593 [Rhodovulum sp. P5]